MKEYLYAIKVYFGIGKNGKECSIDEIEKLRASMTIEEWDLFCLECATELHKIRSKNVKDK